MKRKFALLLSLTVLLCSCSEKTGSGDTLSTTTTTAPTDTSETTTATTTTQPPSSIDPFEELKYLDKELKILGYGDDYTLDLLEKVFGYSEMNQDNSSVGGVMLINVPVVDIKDELAQLVASGDSPDICSVTLSNFPHIMSGKFFQPIDDIVDTYAVEWTNSRKYLDKFMLDGKNYCVIPDAKPCSLFWYRNSVIEETGLEDPYELYQKGEWTWDKLTEMAEKFKNSSEDKFVCDGHGVVSGLLSSSGVPMVDIYDGKVRLNMYDPAAEKAMNYIESLVDNNYRYDIAANRYQPNVQEWVDKNILFFSDSESFYSSTIQKMMRRYEWPENDVGVVPAPASSADEKYINMEPLAMYMYVKGSDNPEGVSAWMRCTNLMAYSTEYKEAVRREMIEESCWTEELIDRIEEFTNDVPIFEFSYGTPIRSDIISYPCDPIGIIKGYYTNGTERYKERRERLGDTMQDFVDEINSYLE